MLNQCHRTTKGVLCPQLLHERTAITQTDHGCFSQPFESSLGLFLREATYKHIKHFHFFIEGY